MGDRSCGFHTTLFSPLGTLHFSAKKSHVSHPLRVKHRLHGICGTCLCRRPVIPDYSLLYSGFSGRRRCKPGAHFRQGRHHTPPERWGVESHQNACHSLRWVRILLDSHNSYRLHWRCLRRVEASSIVLSILRISRLHIEYDKSFHIRIYEPTVQTGIQTNCSRIVTK